MIPLKSMTSDAPATHGSARNFFSRSNGPAVLVCVLLFLALSACGRGGKSQIDSDSAAALIPAGAMLIAGANVPGLVRAFESITGEKIPPTPEGPLLSIGNMFGQAPPPEFVALLKAIDPLKNVQRVLFAGTPSTEAGGRDDHLMFLFEGTFEDQPKIIGALVEGGALESGGPEEIEGLAAYTLKGAAPVQFYFAFISGKRALVAGDAYLRKVAALSRGEGKSIGSNETLTALTNAFSSEATIWGAFSFPEEVKKAMGGAGGGLPGPGGASAPAIKLDAAVLSLDMKGKELSVRLVGASPSAADAENTATTLGMQIGGLTLMAMQVLGPDAIGLMGKLTPKSEGKNVVIAFTLSEEEIAKLQKKAQETLAPALGTLNRGRDEAWKIHCMNNLKQIYVAAVSYANEKKEFPLAQSTEKPRAHDSLNILLGSEYGDLLSPEMFKCSASESQHVHKAGADGKFQLDGHALDYAWTTVSRKLTTSFEKPLAACSHHDGVLVVLMNDGSVRTWDLNDPAVKEKLDPETGLPEGLGR